MNFKKENKVKSVLIKKNIKHKWDVGKNIRIIRH